MLLGLSEAAVRSRLKRGTLRKEKAKDGTVLVVFGSGASPDRPTNSTVRPNDRSSTGQPADQGDLVEALGDQVVFLRQQLEEEREANRENRRIIAALTSRIPELPPARESLRELPQAQQAAAEDGARERSREGTGEPQERSGSPSRLLLVALVSALVLVFAALGFFGVLLFRG